MKSIILAALCFSTLVFASEKKIFVECVATDSEDVNIKGYTTTNSNLLFDVRINNRAPFTILVKNVAQNLQRSNRAIGLQNPDVFKALTESKMMTPFTTYYGETKFDTDYAKKRMRIEIHKKPWFWNIKGKYTSGATMHFTEADAGYPIYTHNLVCR